MTEDEKVTYLFWNNSFEYKEVIQISTKKVALELENFIKSKNGYHPLRYKCDDFKKGVKNFSLKMQGKYNPESDHELDVPEIHSK